MDLRKCLIMKMIKTSFGYMSSVEAKIIGDVDRELKQKKNTKKYRNPKKLNEKYKYDESNDAKKQN